MKTTYIDTDAELAAFLERASGAKVLGIDTEFLRENTYYPILALIQIAAADEIALICPLESKLADLAPVLADPDRAKILHSGSQDMEVLLQFFGVMPQGIIDTQIAASLLGYGEQIGYGNLVQRLCDVRLEKSYSRFDWTKRPLPDRVIQYAAEDVRYLEAMWKKLEAQLVEKGRLSWLWSEQERLTNEATYTPNPKRVHMRVKGVGKLRGDQRKIANGLARVREECAMEHNLPRRWVLPDEVLIDFARRKPKKLADIIGARGFPKRAKGFGEQFLQAIEHPPETEAEPPRKKPLTRAQENAADILSLVIRVCADEHSISAKNIASRKDIESIVRGKRDHSIFQGWRNDVAGKRVEAVLAGAPLHYEDGRIVIGKS